MSRTKFNKNETVSIIGLSIEQYNAISSIVFSAKRCFEEPEENGEYYSNDDFVCSLSPQEKAAMDKADWTI